MFKPLQKKWIKILACVLGVIMLAGALLYACVLLPKKREQEEWDRKVQAYYEGKFAQYRQENERYEDYEIEVAFLGDSLTDGYDLAKYYPQYKTANRGISGDTTVRLESRLQVSVYDLKPQVAVLLIGANNMDTMLDNYESILQGFATNLPQTRVVVLSLTAMGGEHWGRKNQLAAYNNVTLQLLASRYGYEYVDLFSPLYDVTIGEVREGYTVDGGHLTHEGYAVITAEITPVLQQILGK